MSKVVLLGNPSPRLSDGTVAQHMNQSVTRVELWDGIDHPEAVDLALTQTPTSNHNDRLLHARSRALADEHKQFAIAVHEIEELWPVHSAAAKPTYVACDDPQLQAALASYFGCLAGEPVALLANTGRDSNHAQMLSTSAQPASFNYMAISTNTGSGFAASDTTLATELTTNGLGRAQGTYAHTTGTNTSTLTHTWTYTGTGATVIASMAVLNAASAGTLGWEDPLSSSVTVATNGDTCTVTYTLTAG